MAFPLACSVQAGRDTRDPAAPAAEPHVEPLADVASDDPARDAAAVVPLHRVTIRLPSSLGVVDTGEVDASGRPIGIRCATCHGPSGGGEDARSLAERSGLARMHAGVTLAHGELSCATCHPLDDRTQLRLADDTRIVFTEVQRLCRQCHGPQHRDYERGAHGGMRGYWDLGRGPRERNACVMCHAAHAPAYPLVVPAPPPRDRFLSAGQASRPHDGAPEHPFAKRDIARDDATASEEEPRG
jgi:hypothetical protein